MRVLSRETATRFPPAAENSLKQQMADNNNVAIHALWAVVAVVVTFVVGGVTLACVLTGKRRRSGDGCRQDNDDGREEEADDRLPRVALAGNVGQSVIRDVHDEYACRHKGENGVFCSVVPSQSEHESVRAAKHERHATSASAHVSFCVPSCRECILQFGYPVKEAVIRAFARDYKLRVRVDGHEQTAKTSLDSISSSSAAAAATPATVVRRRSQSSTSLVTTIDTNHYDFYTRLIRNCRALLNLSSRAVSYEIIRTLTDGLPRGLCESLLYVERTRIWRATRAASSLVARALNDITGVNIMRRRKDNSVESLASDFWLSLCRQSRQRDPDTCKRREIYYLGMRKEEAWVRYVSHSMHKLGADEEEIIELPDLKFGDIFSVDFPAPFYDKNKSKVLKRSAFLAAIPVNVRTERIVEADDDSDAGESTKEQIEVKYALDALARARGLEEEVTEWVDLDTGVRLAT